MYPPITPSLLVAYVLMQATSSNQGHFQLARDVLFEHLNGYRQISTVGLTDQQVNVLGHDYIASYIQPVPLSHLL